MSDSSSSTGTWIKGIFGTILTGLILWWLTGPLSPFIPPKDRQDTPAPTSVDSKAKVVITDFTLKSPINTGEATTADFIITNEGTVKADACQVIWDTPGKNGAKTSEQFMLQPGETKSLHMVSNAFLNDGTFETKAHLNSGNAGQSDESRQLVVNSIPIGPHIPTLSPSLLHHMDSLKNLGK
ncbi:MAG: hypothetical protein ABI091_23870 [Ferruginibacter sp.]